MEVHTEDSKGGQLSKLPSALGTNLTRLSEMKESSKVYAVPKLDVLSRKSIVSFAAARWRAAKRLEDTGAHGKALGSTIPTQRTRSCSSIKWPAVVGLSAEKRCNHGAAGGDDAQLICALWDDFIAAEWRQSKRHLVGSQRVGREARELVKLRRSFEQPQHPGSTFQFRNEWKLGRAGAAGARVR